ncbi:MAG: asparagine synthetase B, partial [Methylobacteriaceae bacterium]|nr:asparagine synthetase B [Methylobacteriaceae bacterium]
MCGIAGAVSLDGRGVPRLRQSLSAMGDLIAHRGPDGHGVWREERDRCGLAHRRLAIIDLSPAGAQPMTGADGAVIAYNGEIYNFPELRAELRDKWSFRTASDTETILAAHAVWGLDCLRHLRGMFAFAIWNGERLFAARDRFGIKPFYYAVVDGTLYFASEMKALLPFLPDVATDPEALGEYIAFQYTIGEQTLFKGVRTLPPGHALTVGKGGLRVF